MYVRYQNEHNDLGVYGHEWFFGVKYMINQKIPTDIKIAKEMVIYIFELNE